MNLTDSQLRAIQDDAHAILCLSGAGSGKTMVLTHRIARLLDAEHVAPASIACFTFTRRAAESMKRRLADILCERGWTPDESASALRYMLIGTFHSIALRIIREHADRLGYSPNVTVATADDADLLLHTVARDHGHYNGQWLHGMSWKTLSQYRESQYTGEEYEFTGKAAEGNAEICHVLLAEYWQRLRAMNVLDFGLLLREVQRLFRECPDVLAEYRARIKHVLIDECQDLDRVQYNLWEFLVPPATLFAVGDFRQSIYRFRGASPDVLRDKMADGTLTPLIIDLRENFRSGRLIIEAANRLIAHNADGLAPPMLPVPENGDGNVTAIACPLEGLPEVLSLWHSGFIGFPWGGMAVIARKHRTLIDLEQPLRDAGIPFQRVGSAWDICQTPEFQEVHAFLRLQENPRDDLAFLRLFGMKMMPRLYADIRSAAADRGMSHLTAAVNVYAVDWKACGSVELADTLGAMPIPASHDEAARWWLDRFGDMSRADALKVFGVMQMERGEDYRRVDAVTLITSHASKGLEWPFVVVADMNEGAMPAALCRTPEEIEEERRVCFVSVTRAEQVLILHTRTGGELDRVREVSRFLGELGPAAGQTWDRSRM